MIPGPTDCFGDDELGTLLDLPGTDTRRLHLASCTRCAARFATYRRFLDASEAEALRPAEVERLAAFRARLLDSPPVEAPPPAVAEAEPRSPRAPSYTPRTSWRQWLSAAWRPALAVAAVAVVAGAFLLRTNGLIRDDARPTRGSAGKLLRTEVAAQLPNGDVRFTWAARADADHYQVLIQSTGLGLLAHFDAGSDTVLQVHAADLPAAYRNGEVVLFRVIAFMGGDEVDAGTARPMQRSGADAAR